MKEQLIKESVGRILVLTTDLPYFPGKNGHDFFNLRHLSDTHEVNVVAPSYEWFPPESVSNLKQFLTGSYLWPNDSQTIHSFVLPEPAGRLSPWISRLWRGARWRLLRRLLNLHDRPSDGFDKLMILANCAPHLLEALAKTVPHATVLIQTSLEPWLDYLPAVGGRLVYFHDVRADYQKKEIPLSGQNAKSRREIALIHRQEQRITQNSDVVAFVSELDLRRAERLFEMRAAAGVSPIPVDTEYYVPAPAGWKKEKPLVVLFTGHLSHPPNVDSVLYFLQEIWPSILARKPEAIFQVVGMMPAREIQEQIKRSPRCELHANVPDIRPFFWNASVYVVPMRYGGGVRQKLFEAWSMQLPVVCTTMAAEGTGAETGHHCWLEDDPSSFADRVVSICETASLEMISSAKRHVETKNSIAAAAPHFQTQVEQAIRAHHQRPYKLLYDLRWMEIGKAGGVEQATYELISAIGQFDQRNAYRLFAPRSMFSEWRFPKSFNAKLHCSDPSARQLEALKAFLSNRLAETLGLPPLMNGAMRSLAQYHRMDFNLVHSVCGYTHPDLIGFPNILTINDLQHLHYPEFFSESEYEERERLYRESANRAQHIICISEFTRQDVHRQYGVPLEKMTTVWIIPSRNVWRGLGEQEQKKLLAEMDISTPFLFFPAHCWPHKNHERLVEAFNLALSELPKDLKLVFTGRHFPESHPAARMIKDFGIENRVVHLGYRSPLEMRALYQGCLALVFPSLFEGYGMPVAEAIIAGRPVACSNTTSLPEIAGEAALTFDPHDVGDMAARIIELVTRPTLRANLVRAAADQRKKFSARNSAIQTLAVYDRVYKEVYGG